VNSGGSTVASAIISEVEVSDGVGVSYRTVIRFSTTGFQAVDITGSSLSAAVVIDTTLPLEIMHASNIGGDGYIAYRRPWATAWTLVSTSTGTAGL